MQIHGSSAVLPIDLVDTFVSKFWTLAIDCSLECLLGTDKLLEIILRSITEVEDLQVADGVLAIVL